MSDVAGHPNGAAAAPPPWVRATRWAIAAVIAAFAIWCAALILSAQATREELRAREEWLGTIGKFEAELHSLLGRDAEAVEVSKQLGKSLERLANPKDVELKQEERDKLRDAQSAAAECRAQLGGGGAGSQRIGPALGTVLSVLDQLEPEIRYHTIQLSGRQDSEWRLLLIVGMGTLALAALTFFLLHLYVRSHRRTTELQTTVATQQSEKLESLGLLAGGIAHDFNNLLVGILGNADLVRGMVPAESTAGECAEEISTTAKRCGDLARQMLAYAGQARLHVQAVDVNELLEEAGEMLRKTLLHGECLVFDLADGLPKIEADATQLRQVLMNLITNASEALENNKGRISIVTSSRHCASVDLKATPWQEQLSAGHYLQVEVSDDGCGMDRATQAKIFDPFFSTKNSGRGLGLAAAIGIVRAHNGAIQLESERGVGTTFRVLLAATNTGSPSHKRATTTPGHWSGNECILLVDDERVARRVGKRMLEHAGFRVETADDGRAALATFAASPGKFACVVLDVSMPHMDGRQALRELRRLRPELPVIMSSGYERSDATGPDDELGGTGFLRKPYVFDDFHRELEKVFGTPEPPVPGDPQAVPSN